MIHTAALIKRYGAHAALDGVNLDVPADSVYGLAGPNRAGKTTLLGILAGLNDSCPARSRPPVRPWCRSRPKPCLSSGPSWS